jgi:hypothetical protein
MQEGDLVLLMHQYKFNSGSVSITTDGGQKWTTLGTAVGTAGTFYYFWCRFNGTWTADPVTTSTVGSVANSAYIAVFRPTGIQKIWDIDVAFSSATYTAPSTPFSVTITGVTTVHANSVAIGVFASVDDNTWVESSGSWTEMAAQWRNTGGTQQSAVFVYQINATAATATGDAVWDQATNGGDAGRTAKVVFYERDQPFKGIPLPMVGN